MSTLCWKIEIHREAGADSKAEQQKRYYDKATSTVQLMLGDIIHMKLDAFQGKRKVKDKSQMMCLHMR